MNPQIAALHRLQKQDRRLTNLERSLASIPVRIEELDGDLARLEKMLDAERSKFEETRSFQVSQENQLSAEEELIRQSKSRLNQVTTTRELAATQRELDSTRRMASKRSQEIKNLLEGVAEAENRIAAMEEELSKLRSQAEAEKQRLNDSRATLGSQIEKLRAGRGALTTEIDPDTLRTYDRIRKRWGGIAFMPSNRERCSGCKMMIPHQIYVRLVRGDEILGCEHCGRLLYWDGHFPEDPTADEPKPKPAPQAT